MACNTLKSRQNAENWIVYNSSNISPVKQRNNELEGKLQRDIKIQLSYDLNQRTLGASSTILHPLTDVEGQTICSNDQQAKSVDSSSNFFDLLPQLKDGE